MMSKKLFLLLLTGLALFATVACKKVEQSVVQRNPLEIGALIGDYIAQHEKPKDGIITITARSVFSINGHSEPDILIDARFFEGRDGQKPFFAGDLTIGDLLIPYFDNKDASTSGYCLQSVVNLAPSMRASLRALFGNKVRIKLSPVTTVNRLALNSAFPTLVKTQYLDQNGFYLPETIEVQSPMFSNGNYSISTGGNASITWNPDPRNPTGTIFIGLVREMTTDINNPQPGEIVLFKEVPDNGLYSLTAADTEGLPPGSVGSVFIARGSYFTYADPITAREILIEAITYDVVPLAGVNTPLY